MTVGSLKEPIEMRAECDKSRQSRSAKRLSFAYLGPVEWDGAASISYGLWVHIAPGKRPARWPTYTRRGRSR